MAKDKLAKTTPEETSLVPAADFAALIEDNFDGKVNLLSLERVKMPTGGGTNWTYKTMDGEVSTPALTGVIIAAKSRRVFWLVSPEQGGLGQPPDCVSDDAQRGVGTPGTDCDACPYSKFGSAKDGTGRGQACKAIKQLFVMVPGEIFPIVVNLAPTSLAAFEDYAMLCTRARVRWAQIVTRIELEKVTNAQGIPYARATFEKERDLTPQELQNVTEFRAAFTEMFLKNASFQSQDVQTIEAGYAGQETPQDPE